MYIYILEIKYKLKMSKEIILVTGGSGLVGSAIREMDVSYSEYEFIYLTSKIVDLRNEKETIEYFSKVNPTYVIHLAANVGGLFKNMKYKVEMFEDNMRINMNVLKASHLSKVKKVVSCLSTCIFPDQTTYPIDETMLHNGPPHWSNDSYAYSKRMLEVLSKSYQEEYGNNFICVIPCNVYGKHDNFSLEDGHVIPALIHRCYLAKKNGENFVVRGSGKPLRQFIYSEDLARLMMWSLLSYDGKDSLILADEKEWSIEEVAGMIARAFGVEDKMVFDTSKEDGQYKKTASTEKLKKLYENFEFVDMDEKIVEVVEWFSSNSKY
jgi:GDP-L-fucose synthase